MLASYTRGDFPSLGLYRSYLNTALVGLMPRLLRDEGVRSLLEYASDPIGKMREASMFYGQLKRGLARLMGAGGSGEVTITGSTTSCIARIVASILVSTYRSERISLPVAATIHEYPGVVQALKSICRSLRGACAGFTLVGERGVAEWEEHAEAFLEEGGGVLVASGVSWVTGYRADLRRLSARARKSGSYLVVDVAQHLGNTVFRAREEGVDAACGTTKKWLLNPLSSMGIAYVSRRIIESVEPYLFNLNNLVYESSDYCRDDDKLLGDLMLRDDADRFTTISRPSVFAVDIAGMVIDYLLRIGAEAVEDHNLYLRKLFEDLLEEKGLAYSLEGYGFYRKSGIILVQPDRSPGHVLALCKELEKRGIAVSCRGQAGFLGIRVSVHLYNEPEDLHVFIEELGRLLG